MIQNIKFKLCKSFNQIEFEVSDVTQLDREVIAEIYSFLPEYEGTVEPTSKNQPSEAQLKFAKSLGIDTDGKDKEQLRVAIKKATSKKA